MRLRVATVEPSARQSTGPAALAGETRHRRVRRARFPWALAYVIVGGLVGTTVRAAHAASWGDATLSNDDVRVEVDRSGHAIVRHTLKIEVTGRRLKLITIDDVDDGAAAPDDLATQAGRDGPGWPAILRDAKGATLPALIEPAHEPRRLRLLLGAAGGDGIARGIYEIEVRYALDRASSARLRHAEERGDQGAEQASEPNLFEWSAPHWPSGYDGSHVTFAFAAAPTPPRLSAIVRDGIREPAADAAGLVEIRRAGAFDELTITRPHVPQGDDTVWAIAIDPKAIAPLGGTPLDRTATATDGDFATGGALGGFVGFARSASSLALVVGGVSLAIGAAVGWLLDRRHRAAATLFPNHAAGWRPLVPLGDARRSVRPGLYGALAAITLATPFAASSPLSLSLSTSALSWGAALATLAAMALATLRPPRASTRSRAEGRWLATPRTRDRVPKRDVRATLASIGFEGGAFVAAIAVACAFAAAHRWGAARAFSSIAALLIPLVCTGRRWQLPIDGDEASRRFAALARKDASKSDRWTTSRIARSVRTGGIDDVRVLITPRQEVRAQGLSAIELASAEAHGLLARTAIAELIVRVERGSEAERALVATLDDRLPAASHVWSLGRRQDERVLSIRPSDASTRSLRAWIAWTIDRVAPVADVEQTQSRAPRPPAATSTPNDAMLDAAPVG